MSVLPFGHDKSVDNERQVLLLSRYPTFFVPFYEKHWKTLSVVALAALLFSYGVLTLGVSPSKILFGLGELTLMVMRMFPPDAHQFNTYLYAIAETLAIALLGTLSAAVVAFPLGFLAARNTTINRFVHFFARRSFDTLRTTRERSVDVSDVLCDFGLSNRQLAPVLKDLRLRGKLATSRPIRLHSIRGFYCRPFIFADDRQEVVLANGLYITL
jgi:hypothetical protein